MTKKNNTALIISVVIISILVIGILGFLAYSQGYILRSPINEAYRTQIDRLSPNYINLKQLACIDHSGDWLDSRRGLGCFNIGEDWDSSWCTSTEGSTVEDICNSIEGANWYCDQNNAGCKY